MKIVRPITATCQQLPDAKLGFSFAMSQDKSQMTFALNGIEGANLPGSQPYIGTVDFKDEALHIETCFNNSSDDQGLPLLYDWVFHDLPETAKTLIQQKCQINQKGSGILWGQAPEWDILPCSSEKRFDPFDL